jgi:hypothetical protein
MAKQTVNRFERLGKIACGFVMAASLIVIIQKLWPNGTQKPDVVKQTPPIPADAIKQLLQQRAQMSESAKQEPGDEKLTLEQKWDAARLAVKAQNGRRALALLGDVLHAKTERYDDILEMVCPIADSPQSFNVDEPGLLKLLTDADALPLIESALKGALEPNVRRRFIRALTWNSGAGAEQMIITELKRKTDPKSMHECIRALEGRESSAALQALSECANASDLEPRLRMAAAESMGHMQIAGVDEILTAIAQSSGDAQIREHVLGVLQTRHPPVEGLLVTGVSQLPDDKSLRQSMAPMLGMELLIGDVLTACNGVPFQSTQEIFAAVQQAKEPNANFSFQVFRRGQSIELQATGPQAAFALSLVRTRFAPKTETPASSRLASTDR